MSHKKKMAHPDNGCRAIAQELLQQLQQYGVDEKFRDHWLSFINGFVPGTKLPYSLLCNVIACFPKCMITLTFPGHKYEIDKHRLAKGGNGLIYPTTDLCQGQRLPHPQAVAKVSISNLQRKDYAFWLEAIIHLFAQTATAAHGYNTVTVITAIARNPFDNQCILMLEKAQSDGGFIYKNTICTQQVFIGIYHMLQCLLTLSWVSRCCMNHRDSRTVNFLVFLTGTNLKLPDGTTIQEKRWKIHDFGCAGVASTCLQTCTKEFVWDTTDGFFADTVHKMGTIDGSIIVWELLRTKGGEGSFHQLQDAFRGTDTQSWEQLDDTYNKWKDERQQELISNGKTSTEAKKNCRERI